MRTKEYAAGFGWDAAPSPETWSLSSAWGTCDSNHHDVGSEDPNAVARRDGSCNRSSDAPRRRREDDAGDVTVRAVFSPSSRLAAIGPSATGSCKHLDATLAERPPESSSHPTLTVLADLPSRQVSRIGLAGSGAGDSGGGDHDGTLAVRPDGQARR